MTFCAINKNKYKINLVFHKMYFLYIIVSKSYDIRHEIFAYLFIIIITFITRYFGICNNVCYIIYYLLHADITYIYRIVHESSPFRLSDFEVEKCRSKSHQPHIVFPSAARHSRKLDSEHVLFMRVGKSSSLT